MSLLAPLALLGLLGLAGPLVAHLLGRERPDKIPFAAVRFLRSTQPVVSQRRELRDRPLLALRLLLLAVFVLILARPVVDDEAAVAVLAEPHDAVILVDASGSMELRVDGERERERAIERVDALLDALPPGSRVGLVVSDPRAPELALAELGDGRPRIRASLDAWMASREDGPRPGAWSLVEALPRAAAQLGAVEARPRVIYAVGDQTARGLGSLPRVAEGAVSVIPIPTRGQPGEDPPPSPEHVGIRELDWEPAPELDPKAVRIRALIHRYGGDERVLEVQAALEIGGEELARTTVELDADDEGLAEFTHVLDGSGDRAAVELVDRRDDPLPIDDRRHLWLRASEAIEVLVINGDPSETRVNDEIFFLSTALASSELAETMELRALTLDQLEDRLARRREHEDADDPLARVDVLVLANVRAIAPELAPLISERVAGGMGLWISVGDRVSASEYNARYEPLLPLLLREAVYTGTAPGRTEARSEGLAPVVLSHPIFDGAASEDIELDATRTRRMFLLEPDPRRGADIAVAFTSGAPALITRSHGQGHVALLTTTVDRDWGDLPLRPGFVPVATRTLAWLAKVSSESQGSEVGVGAVKRLEHAAPYVVSTPAGRRIPVAPSEEGAPARFDATDQIGHYRATPQAEQGDEAEGLSERFVVSVDAREAETAPASIERPELAERSGTVTIYSPRWRELALLALVLLALESGARLWLGRRADAKA